MDEPLSEYYFLARFIHVKNFSTRIAHTNSRTLNLFSISLIFLLSVLFIVNCTLLTVNCYAQPFQQEWVRRYTDTASSQWQGRSIKLDSLGFIYVLGETPNDFGFLKYNPSGNILLVATYWPGGYDYGGGSYFDVTGSGDVYLTGGVSISLNDWMYTVKFNTNGVFQWGKLYGAANTSATNDIKVDKAGNVIIVGGATVKYNPSGDTLWSRHFASNQKVVLDDSNNIYATGYIGGACSVLKYSPSGNLDWFTTFTLDPVRSNIGSGIALDIIGNIYVIGTQVVSGPGYHNYLLKMSNGGNIIWNKVFTGINDGQAGTITKGPVISYDGNSIYYTTSSGLNNGSQYRVDIVTLKYNSLGDSQWVRLYQGSGQQTGSSNGPSGVKLDRYDNIYICGLSNNQTTGDDFVTIKYTPAGVQQWVATYSGEMTNGSESAEDLFIDTNLSVYVTGSGQNLHSGIDAIIIKYNQPVGISNNTSELPKQFKLYQNYPNPFNSSTEISYEVPHRSSVDIKVFNMLGQEIRTLVNKTQQAGTYILIADFYNLPSGIYFYRMQGDGKLIETKKLILIK
jgi:hypothetical protein